MLKGNLKLDAPFGVRKEVLKAKPAATAKKAALAVQEVRPEDEWLDATYDRLSALKGYVDFREELTEWLDRKERLLKLNLEKTPDA